MATWRGGMWYVPKRKLIGALVAALENDRLQIASGLRYAAALVGELQTFRRRVTGAGRAAYGAETGAHDDLVVAVALAVWGGSRGSEAEKKRLIRIPNAR